MCDNCRCERKPDKCQGIIPTRPIKCTKIYAINHSQVSVKWFITWIDGCTPHKVYLPVCDSCPCSTTCLDLTKVCGLKPGTVAALVAEIPCGQDAYIKFEYCPKCCDPCPISSQCFLLSGNTCGASITSLI